MILKVEERKDKEIQVWREIASTHPLGLAGRRKKEARTEKVKGGEKENNTVEVIFSGSFNT